MSGRVVRIMGDVMSVLSAKNAEILSTSWLTSRFCKPTSALD